MSRSTKLRLLGLAQLAGCHTLDQRQLYSPPMRVEMWCCCLDCVEGAGGGQGGPTCNPPPSFKNAPV